ncbi:outer membrane assembly lipoprotein YfiO [Sphingomonas sp. ABOLD]|uniref:Outer membrane assembly lipoprotein YfiO n=1 Tax=Sphingomonas trueperi TaxID=53317 RepID=A0A7X5Y2T3_9SPHN|nr:MULTISPECIES: outer membrane assembly lipoprotein YfiO [Sphingomonas]NJB98391.1 hypothetical protein [Sphingomonas trueperi]RSV45218.1 outer membrane assembly lipoprotein YfiO [Sphingomonas sp. ABOLD]
MIRTLFFLLLGMGALWSVPAHASGDYSCGPAWKLRYAAYSGCDDLAMLGPRNDSRTNLALLLADLPGAARLVAPAKPSVFLDIALLMPRSADGGSPYFSDGEGSRCRSNVAGTERFEAAIRANAKVPEPERAALIAARKGLAPDCTQGTAGSAALVAAVNGAKSEAGKAFAAYLDGAAAFYAGDYDGAAARFASLGNARDAWLRETGRYMLGRVAVNQAQVDYYDDYGSPKQGAKVAPTLVAEAENALRGYMKAYPQGEYFFSARGLLRRVYWLAQDRAKLEAEYAALIALPDAKRGIDAVSLAQEIDAKLLAGATADSLHDPILLAAFDLMHMRTGERGETCCDALSRAALDAQRAKFASKPALFAFLQATHAYHLGGQPQQALELLPDASHQANFSYLEFSRQMLRGMALEARADRNVRGFWIDLLSGAKAPRQRPVVELALALHDERHDGLARLFASDSPIRSQEIRDRLLMNVADAKLLRQQAQAVSASAHERDVALFTLLYKEATRGSHRDFVEDVRLVPASAPIEADYYFDFSGAKPLPTGLFVKGKKLGDYGCPALSETQRRLAAAPRNAKAMLCLGEFTRVNGFDGFLLDSQPARDELGGTPTRFAGVPYSRLDAYQAVMASAAASPDDKAYALFRAVNCYAPSASNACGGKGVEPAVRKGWFQRLKRDYPKSRWAQELRYYW